METITAVYKFFGAKLENFVKFLLVMQKKIKNKMSLLLRSQIKIICQEIRKECEKKKRRSTRDLDALRIMLTQITPIEKLFIAKFFCKSPYNIGSLRVLSILQNLRILTAKEFILSLDNAEETQLILNDFIEDESELYCHLFIAACYDALYADKLNIIIDESLTSLFTYFLQHPTTAIDNNLNYLTKVKETLPVDVLQKVIQKHIDIVLELHSSTSVKDAFKNFSIWINEGVDEIKFTRELHKKLLSLLDHEALSYLFKLSTMAKFKEWKFYLIILQTIASDCTPETATYIRKYLQSRLRQIAAVPDKNSLLHLLLTARAATATTLEVFKNVSQYADWYKQNIADMKFILKTEEFQNIIALLQNCIDYEYEETYLDIHAKMNISPPVHCGRIVQAYKSKCKIRLSQVKGSGTPPEAYESIMLIDSD